MRYLIASLLLIPAICGAQLSAQYGVQRTVYLQFWDTDATPLVGEVDGGTEVTLSCDAGTPATATNDFGVDTNTPGRYSLVLTAAELQCATLTIDVAASVAQSFVLESYGHASAQHPVLGWQTGDAFARLGAPIGASISADIAAVPTAFLAEVIEDDPSITVADAFCLWNAILLGESEWTGSTASAWHSPGGTDTNRAQFAMSGSNRTSATLTLPCNP